MGRKTGQRDAAYPLRKSIKKKRTSRKSTREKEQNEGTAAKNEMKGKAKEMEDDKKRGKMREEQLSW